MATVLDLQERFNRKKAEFAELVARETAIREELAAVTERKQQTHGQLMLISDMAKEVASATPEDLNRDTPPDFVGTGETTKRNRRPRSQDQDKPTEVEAA